MKFIIDKPYRVLIPEGIDMGRLSKFLTFKDKSISFAIRKLKENRHWDQDYVAQRLEELQRQQHRCLMYEDGDLTYTYSGLAGELSTFFGIPIENTVEYPAAKSIPWAVVPAHQLRPYQEQIVDKLLEVRHGSVSVGTGLGKSLCVLNLVKRLGLPALIVTPSVSIAGQMFELFKTAFGSKYVGMFGDGKKQFQKKFVIGIAQSLTRLGPDDEAYLELSKKQVLAVDESHLLPAGTFEKVCVGVGASAPYRFSFSGTQTRTDGAELLLKGLIGPIVFSMTVEDGVKQGYLARPIFKMIRTQSFSSYRSRDANSMDRQHLLLNQKVISNAASIANGAAAKGMPVLILIDEFEQAALLDKYLTWPREFAHGGIPSLTPRERSRQQKNPNSVRDLKDLLPAKFHTSDPTDQVRRFNAGEFPILLGTSAIGLGTDVLPVKVLILIRKGTSVIKFAQSVGRGTRKVPGKEEVIIFDFDVVNVDIVHRHALAREAIYNDILGPVQHINLVGKIYE